MLLSSLNLYPPSEEDLSLKIDVCDQNIWKCVLDSHIFSSIHKKLVGLIIQKFTRCRGSFGEDWGDLTGSAGPVDFGIRVIEPVNYSWGKTEKDKNSDFLLVACYTLLSMHAFPAKNGRWRANFVCKKII